MKTNGFPTVTYNQGKIFNIVGLTSYKINKISNRNDKFF